MRGVDFDIPKAAPAPGDGTAETSIDQRVEHGYAQNASDGTKIHYAALGKGSLVVMLHGFPDYWYTWRYNIAALSKSYRVVAPDLRGYNLSDKPEGVESYDMRLLVGDVRAVIRSSGYEQAVIVGHDWGGAIAWQLAMHLPEAVEKLIILNVPHPRGLTRELANNPEQRKSSRYARDFQEEGAHLVLTPQELASWVADPSVRKKYVEAFERSDIEAMLNYYKRNYPREPYRSEVASPLIKVRVPVLMIYGLQDPHLLHGGLAGTWEWVEDLTLVTVPRAGHFVHLDAANLVHRTIAGWLAHGSSSFDSANGDQVLKRRANPSKRALREAIDYVEDKLARNLTLAEIAGAACMSPYHFLRLFKESMGLTPHQYVLERRVERAKELLGGSALSISEVALTCGFADQSHLNRHFKRLVGFTPKAFRRRASSSSRRKQ